MENQFKDEATTDIQEVVKKKDNTIKLPINIYDFQFFDDFPMTLSFF